MNDDILSVINSIESIKKIHKPSLGRDRSPNSMRILGRIASAVLSWCGDIQIYIHVDRDFNFTSLDYSAPPRFFEKLNKSFNNPAPSCPAPPPYIPFLPPPLPPKVRLNKIINLKTISGPRWICVQNLGQIGPAVLPWWWDIHTEITTLYI